MLNKAPNPEYISTRHAALLFGVEPLTVRRWIASGKLSARRIGRIIRIPMAEVRAFKENMPHAGKQNAH